MMIQTLTTYQKYNYFDHVSPSGKTLQDRIYDAKYPCYPMGENIEENYISPDMVNSIIQTWMNSQGHRENILLPIYDREGIGVSVSFDNQVYITQDFC